MINFNDESDSNNKKEFSIKSLVERTLEWPSYSVSILSENEKEEKINFLLGTNTNNTESNYLISAFYDIETKQINIKRKRKKGKRRKRKKRKRKKRKRRKRKKRKRKERN